VRQNNLDAISSVLVTWKGDFSEPVRNSFFSWKGDFSNRKGDSFSGRQNNLDAISSVLATWKTIFRNRKVTLFQLKSRFSEPVLTTWKSIFPELKENAFSLEKAISRTEGKCFFFRKGDCPVPERGRFCRAPEQPWRNFERLGDLKKRVFRMWKKELFQLKRRFSRTWKGTLFQGARTTLTQFRASWRPEKANFPNLMEIAISAEKANYPNLKGDAFAGRRNNVDAISSVLATWKSEISEPERNRCFQFKKLLSESERTSFITAPEQPWQNFEFLGDQKKRFFQTWKNLLFLLKRRFFRTWNGTLSLDARTTLMLFRASWRTEKGIFSEPERNRFLV